MHKATLTTHGNRVERRRRRQQHARADGFGRGGAATAWAAAALSARGRARRLPAQLERGQVQGSVAAREARRRWWRRRRQQHAQADGFGRAEQRPPGRPLLCLPDRAVCAARARSGAGSVAARGRAAAVASRRAARARRGGQVIGRRVMGRRVTAPPAIGGEPVVARPQLTSKACGARLSVSVGSRHVARREGDKCASYGSLFIGQSSGR